LLSLLFGLSVLLFTGSGRQLASLAAEGNAVERFSPRLRPRRRPGIIVFAVVHMLAGYGVLQMQNWGRLLTLLFSAIGLVLVLPGWSTRTCFSRCSLERLTPPASFIWPCLRSSALSTPKASPHAHGRLNRSSQFSSQRSSFHRDVLRTGN
jgi:hypothetical protein